MARVAETITISMELRPCLVRGEKCLFHKWVTGYHPRANHLVDEDGEDYCEVMLCETPMALVEHEDGTVTTESAEAVKFADSKGLFGEYAF